MNGGEEIIRKATNSYLTTFLSFFLSFLLSFFLTLTFSAYYRGADKSLPDQEGNKLGSMSGTRAISTTSRRELSSSFFSCKARRRRKFTPF